MKLESSIYVLTQKGFTYIVYFSNQSVNAETGARSWNIRITIEQDGVSDQEWSGSVPESAFKPCVTAARNLVTNREAILKRVGSRNEIRP